MMKFRYCSKVLLSTTKSKISHNLKILRYSSNHTTSQNVHRSNAEELINKVPVIEVPGHVAVCDGGSGALGHPIEYIQLDTVSKKPAICKYCGLRYKMSEKAHHH